jgi:hypothetical protein
VFFCIATAAAPMTAMLFNVPVIVSAGRPARGEVRYGRPAKPIGTINRRAR